MNDAAAEFSAALKQMVAPNEAAADRLVAAATRYNASLDEAMESCFAEGFKAGLASKAGSSPTVNITLDPGAISLALPDAVRVQLEPSRTEAVVQRDADGNLTGIRTVSA
jgi:hypothetical protein